MSYFIFNETSSDTLGIKIQSKEIYSAPKYDLSLISIPGRDGDIVSDNGRFNNVSVSYTCYLPAKSISELNTKIRNVKKFLYKEINEYHELSDSFDMDFFRYAIFNSKLDIEEEAKKIGLFKITFSCRPYRYDNNGQTAQTYASSFTLRNPYPFTSKPYLKISGSGNGTVVIQNLKGTKTWTLTNIDGYIEIDSELMNCFKGTTLKNSDVNGSGFPLLTEGDSIFSFTGGITGIQIIPRWVCL